MEDRESRACDGRDTTGSGGDLGELPEWSDVGRRREGIELEERWFKHSRESMCEEDGE